MTHHSPPDDRLYRTFNDVFAMRLSVPIVVFALSCSPAGLGLRPTPIGTGPTVLVDWDAHPFPDLPFPNDLAARPDPTSPTGLRINISLEGDTQLERDARERLDKMTGFGIYAPITVAFEAPLDLDVIATQHDINGDLSDDSVFLVDITPSSPDYLQAIDLDVGHGRFPGILPTTDVFFPNDTRAHSASLRFETVDEDLDGDGILDPGEDTDNDGVLDKPNVYPVGGDPWHDLLTWYERETDTLIVRPILPLREQTTYAVVLTNRLVGLDGQPVQSPWASINHTRQTQALSPLHDALAELGLTVDDVAFTWSFTTGRVTGDLLDIRAGLDGEGPWAFLRDEFPAQVEEALLLQQSATADNPYLLQWASILSLLVDLELLPNDSDWLIEQYELWSQAIVSGAFTTPFFLTDRDDGGEDWSDEVWELDPGTGEIVVGPQRVPFTCFLPRETIDHQPPFPVVMGGHGQGGTRFQLLMLAWAVNRFGFALCGFDLPGHGGAIPEEEYEMYRDLVELLGLAPFVESFMDARHRDLDNDGHPESGADFFVANPFHTRDMLRQTTVDLMQALRALRHCGTGTMGVDVDADGIDEVSCDWDGDGTPDIGGPDVDYLLLGASLGGVNLTITTAVEPDFAATVALIPGGGLFDALERSYMGGVFEPSVGRLLTPLLVSSPQDGDVILEQIIISADHDVTLPIAVVPPDAFGGRVIIENVDSGIVREGMIEEDGRLRVPFPADAMDAYEKRQATGMPPTGPADGMTYTIPDNAGLGDSLIVTFLDDSGHEVGTVDTWTWDTIHEGVTYGAGSPLVAGSEGLGRIRNSPELRQLFSVMSIATEPGDPIAYAPHIFDRPYAELDYRSSNILIMPTPGDDTVPTANGIALARAAGLYDPVGTDERYGTSIDAWLIDTEVIRGVVDHGSWVDDNGEPMLFDPDNLDNGTDGLDAPSDQPLRATRWTDAGTSALRIPYVDPRGSHGFGTPNSSLPFDINTFATMQAAWYLYTRGQEVRDDPCLERGLCNDFPWRYLDSTIKVPEPWSASMARPEHQTE